MRVLISRQAEAQDSGRAVAAALAGPDGHVVSLFEAGVRNLARPLSQAEVHAVRKALLGVGPGEDLRPRDPADQVVGYVCCGREAGGDEGPLGAGPAAGTAPLPVTAAPRAAPPATVSPGPMAAPRVLAVADHVNLTWRSPLRGGNEERLGPRFPVTAGLYDPEAVRAGVPGGEEIPAVVTVQVARAAALTAFERETVRALDVPMVSEELVPVALLAAHLGYRVAAALVLDETDKRAS